jgi:hypothetical protein
VILLLTIAALWHNGSHQQPFMKTSRKLRKLIAGAVLVCALLGNPLHLVHPSSAQSSAVQPNSVDIEQILFVQTMPLKNGKTGIVMLWIPDPLQKYCLGKTSEQCATMDFCLRTTTPSIAMCRNLGSALQRMPRYPREMRPARQLSIVFFPPSTIQGFDIVQNLVQTVPQPSLERLSLSARVKARIRFTRSPNDDDFKLLEVLAAPPF